MRQVLLLAIAGYRRFLSPRKRGGCALRVHRGRPSCSAVGLRAVRRHGAWRGLALIRERTARCGHVHRQAHRPPPGLPAGQRGVCDPPCCDLPCDAPACDAPCDLDGVGDTCRSNPPCCDCSCDWPRRRSDEDRRDA